MLKVRLVNNTPREEWQKAPEGNGDFNVNLKDMLQVDAEILKVAPKAILPKAPMLRNMEYEWHGKEGSRYRYIGTIDSQDIRTFMMAGTPGQKDYSYKLLKAVQRLVSHCIEDDITLSLSKSLGELRQKADWDMLQRLYVLQDRDHFMVASDTRGFKPLMRSLKDMGILQKNIEELSSQSPFPRRITDGDAEMIVKALELKSGHNIIDYEPCDAHLPLALAMSGAVVLAASRGFSMVRGGKEDTTNFDTVDETHMELLLRDNYAKILESGGYIRLEKGLKSAAPAAESYDAAMFTNGIGTGPEAYGIQNLKTALAALKKGGRLLIGGPFEKTGRLIYLALPEGRTIGHGEHLTLSGMEAHIYEIL